MTERRPVDILRHEAGHMIVAKLLGFKTGGLSYKSSHAGAELTIEPKLPDLSAVSAFIRRRVVVLYAGVLAESLKGGEIDNDRALQLIRGPEAADDYSKARELVRVLAGTACGEGDYQELLNKFDSQLWNQAAALVKKFAQQIEALSKNWREMLGGRSEIEILADQISSIPCFEEIKAGSEIEQF
jgi:hypothetical protein